MKIGIISDIHGNIKALEAVLKELENKNIDKIICLGDMIDGAPMPESVIQRMMQIKNLIIVRGNHERYIIEGMPKIVHDENVELSKEQLDANEWIKGQLSDSSKNFIRNLKKELFIEIYGKKIYLVHYPMNEDESFRKHIRNASVEENETMFSGIEADIYLYGHTHEEIYNVKDNKIYINPGALGCPGKTQYAPYGILNICDEKIEYNQLYAKYDVQEVIEYINKMKVPEYRVVLRIFYGIDDD